MMDIVLLLLFMAIFYLGPALLKRYRAKNNVHSAAPDLLNAEMMSAPPKVKKEAYMPNADQMQSTVVVDKVNSLPTIMEDQSAWHGKLNHNMITNGVIFAEILQPPRAYRPFVRR